MSLLAMPWLVLNMGCEMVYILEQRLKAQGVAQDKAATVLADIVRALVDPASLAGRLFVPQELYSPAAMRKVFDRLAHASIMRLSEGSMGKLYDLVTMGAKYQLLAATRLDDAIVNAILTTALAACSPSGAVDGAVIGLVGAAEEAVVRLYGTLPAGELGLLRRTLARFFQGRRVKVSLFLAEGIQLHSARLVAPSCLCARVGAVRLYDAAGRLQAEQRHDVASQQARRGGAASRGRRVHAAAAEFFCHPVPLGDNLYRKDRAQVVPPPRRAGDAPAPDAAQPAPDGAGAGAPQPDGGGGGGAAAAPAAPAASEPGRAREQSYPGDSAAAGGRAAAAELGLLASLVAAPPTGGDTFRLDLSGEPGDAADPPAPSGAPPVPRARELRFGGAADGRAARVAAGLDDDGRGGAFLGGGGGEDLLALMDGLGNPVRLRGRPMNALTATSMGVARVTPRLLAAATAAATAGFAAHARARARRAGSAALAAPPAAAVAMAPLASGAGARHVAAQHWPAALALAPLLSRSAVRLLQTVLAAMAVALRSMVSQLPLSQLAASRADARPAVDLAAVRGVCGSWTKDGAASEGMEPFCELFGVPRWLRSATRLMAGLHISVEGDVLLVRQVCKLRWLGTVEAFPLDGVRTAPHRRRDMRAGRQLGQLVSARDGEVCLRAAWDGALAGEATDVLSLDAAGRLVVRHRAEVAGKGVAAFTEVFSRA
ncbi:Oscp1 [Scenedesmus sp. PABB004]|nr:Oscp1 [Scenedesmus sp. PABB004]